MQMNHLISIEQAGTINIRRPPIHICLSFPVACSTQVSFLMFDQVHVVSSFAPRTKPDDDGVWMVVIAVGNEYNITDWKIQVLL